MRKIIGIIFFLIGLGTLSFISWQELKPIDENTPNYFHHYPEKLSSVWNDTAISISQFSEEEIAYQKKLNEKEEHILSYSPTDSKKEWTSIDYEEITPYTWKWIILECRKPDGSLSKIKLRRPNNWIKSQDADKIGATVQLDLPEMGIIGEAKVTDIVPNQLDTRFWNEGRKGDYVYRPITGFFEHESREVWHLYFEHNQEPLGVTSSHPIWSVDGNNWVSAENLKVGEKVKTKEGITVLQSKEKQDTLQKVYNLEIYKDHNFHVAEEGILVHNNSSFLKKNASDFKLLHSEDVIKKDAGYKKIMALSDEELIESVYRPKDGQFIEVNMQTGKVIQGNTRLYELKRRGLDIEVPYKEYNRGDNDYFFDM